MAVRDGEWQSGGPGTTELVGRPTYLIPKLGSPLWFFIEKYDASTKLVLRLDPSSSA